MQNQRVARCGIVARDCVLDPVCLVRSEPFEVTRSGSHVDRVEKEWS